MLARKHRTTAQSPGSVLDFWQTPAKPCFIRWHRLEQMGELSKETVFIDGNGAKPAPIKNIVWKKSVGKWEEKMFLKYRKGVTLMNQEYLQSSCSTEETQNADKRFIEQVVKPSIPLSILEEEDAKKAGTRYLGYRRFLEPPDGYGGRHTASFQGKE